MVGGGISRALVLGRRGRRCRGAGLGRGGVCESAGRGERRGDGGGVGVCCIFGCFTGWVEGGEGAVDVLAWGG